MIIVDAVKIDFEFIGRRVLDRFGIAQQESAGDSFGCRQFWPLAELRDDVPSGNTTRLGLLLGLARNGLHDGATLPDAHAQLVVCIPRYQLSSGHPGIHGGLGDRAGSFPDQNSAVKRFGNNDTRGRT